MILTETAQHKRIERKSALVVLNVDVRFTNDRTYGYDLRVAAMPLPSDARPYRRTEIFTEATIPKALQKAHSTKQDVWALIHVLEGQLIYRISDPTRPAHTEVLTPETPPGVIEPAILHEVAPLGPVRFYVEFHRRAQN